MKTNIVWKKNSIALKDYLAFQFVDFERTWWRLFQEHVVRTKLDISVYFNTLISI